MNTNTIKILIVEDTYLIVERLNKGLKALDGAEIIGHTDNSMEAIDTYNELKPNIMILDLMLKSNTGFDVLESVKYRPESSIVVVLSSSKNSFIKQSCLDSGADYVLDKSNDFDSLLTICKDSLTKHLLSVNNAA